jgi:solute carrier family 25 protein 16
MFKGNGANLARTIPFAGIQFYSYNFFKTQFFQGEQETLACRFLAGAGAGLIATLFTYPLDPIRSLLSVTVPHGKQKRLNMMGAAS